MPEKPSEAPVDERAPAPSGRERLRSVFLARPSRGQAVVALLLAAVGFAAMTQVQHNERDDDYTGLRQDDLIRVFDGLSASSQRAENEIDRLTELRNDLRDESSKRQAALDQAREDTDVYAILAGTVPASGPGVRITITDDEGNVDADTLLDAIQELRAAGAEVMEFNDRVRVIAQSSIVQTSLGIELDGQLLEAPFVIDVIGEPNTLAGALDFPDGPKEVVEEEGGSVTVEELEELEVASVVKDAEGDFAEPREDQ
ncbi:DUF881 domain-containing protein [Nocardioides sp. JQ2195]|uniref:DUF881 domain-containing protein n=1 Tax=Nocardioides sp. JQ2195 TaxID=2592334 RepID=UPI00143E4410|nr:DUF881 domain-containing protein [Nocardioides sp. JQ2195]QIX26851.1 DUF881 domain-containing protein [Nocardioides sp. JQ2195]